MDEVYYIRPADSETARGPFDIDKLNTLAEAGQVARETLYYDESLQAWAAIGSNRELSEKIFPSKKNLILRKDELRQRKTPAAVADERRAVISVEEMLAAAEGKTEETQHLKETIRWQHRAASMAVPVLAIVCFVSAATFIYPSWSAIQDLIEQKEGAGYALLRQPLLILGVVDFFCGLCLALAATEVYPLLRVRAAFGAGYFGFSYWAASVHGDPLGLYLCLATVAYGIGVFTCTLTLNFRLMLAAGGLSLTGAIVFAYFTTFQPLIDRF
jgi:hypothetical protein